MTKTVENVLKAAAILAAIGGLEFYFFRAPDLASPLRFHLASNLNPRPARAATFGWSGSLARSRERHLRNIRQLTFGGENTEAHWSFDGKQISWQGNPGNLKADQIFLMNADGSNKHLVSTGKGKCTGSYFSKDGKWVYFASTHLGTDEPPEPDRSSEPDRSPVPGQSKAPGVSKAPGESKEDVRPVSDTYDIFRVHADGTGIEQITDTPGYDAEAAISPDGKRIVFTSTRDGDLELYTMNLEGKHVRRLTHELGYDGSAFFSPDGKQICYCAHHPQKPAEIQEYPELLAQQLVKPLRLDLFVMNSDGSNKRQLTNNGAANLCPCFTPDGSRLIFASNRDDPQEPDFDLYLINLDGSGLERVTTDPAFDGSPMFSPDGKKLIWAANRNGKTPQETNLFVADWVP